MDRSGRIDQRRSLSQVILHNRRYLNCSLKRLNEWGVQHVLEIGPGGGALTRLLVEHPWTILAVEKDTRFADALLASLASPPNLSVTNVDVLEFDLGQFI